MSIHSVTGLPRQGKTYHTHVHEVIGALQRRVRVLTNISGYEHPDVRAAICVYYGIPMAVIDKCLIQVSVEQLQDPKSYPCDKNGNFVPGTLIEPGDKVIIDEVFVVWPTGAGRHIDARIHTFFRLHGKFVGEHGYTCQVILITQAITDLHRDLRVVVEYDHEVVKMAHVGMDKRYRVTTTMLIEGRRVIKYRAKYYKRTRAGEKSYRSMFAKDGNSESGMGKTGSTRPWWILGISVAVLGLAAWFLLFHNTLVPAAPVPVKPVQQSQATSTPSGGTSQKGVTPSLSDMFKPVELGKPPVVGSDPIAAAQRTWWSQNPELGCWNAADLGNGDGSTCRGTQIRTSIPEVKYWSLESLAGMNLTISSQPCSLTISGGGYSRTWIRSDCYERSSVNVPDPAGRPGGSTGGGGVAAGPVQPPLN